VDGTAGGIEETILDVKGGVVLMEKEEVRKDTNEQTNRRMRKVRRHNSAEVGRASVAFLSLCVLGEG
jgi:hypothetical protein